jgi:hypothetical protein
MPIAEPWYLHPDSYWVDAAEENEYPSRYGDLFNAPQGCVDANGNPWPAALVLHPSGDLGAKAKPLLPILVARVEPVAGAGRDQAAQTKIRAGWAERDGVVLVAFANSCWLSAPPDAPDTDLYVDFRKTRTVTFAALCDAGRRAAMTHDARVHVIRREIYFKYRWKTTLADVFAAERERIGGDPTFGGPRPAWAS